MRIGFFAVGIGNLSKPEILAAAAQEGEEAGFSTLWAAEHVVLLEKFESVYPYARTLPRTRLPEARASDPGHHGRPGRCRAEARRHLR
jgi:hypothetical protein